MPGIPAGIGQLRPQQPRGPGQPAFPGTVREAEGAITMTFSAAAGSPGLVEAYAGALDALPPADLGSRIFSRRAAGPARAARGAVHRPRTADRTRPADHHQRRPCGHQPGRAHRPRARGPGAGRVTELSQCAGIVPPTQCSTGAGADDRDRLGSRRSPRRCASRAPRLAYLIPDFHNPTGALLDAGDRRQLGSALRRDRCIPLVDETLVELGLDGSTDAAAVRRRQPGHDHRRLGQQGVLGRTADRLDPRAAGRWCRAWSRAGPSVDLARRRWSNWSWPSCSNGLR